LSSRVVCFRIARPKPQRKAKPRFIYRPLSSRVVCLRIARPRLRCNPKRHSDFIAVVIACRVPLHRSPKAAAKSETAFHLLPVVIAYHVLAWYPLKAAAKTETAFHLLPVVILYRVPLHRSPTAAMQAKTALGFYCPLLSRVVCLRIARPKLRCNPKRHSDFIVRCYRVPCACVVPAQSRSEKRIHLLPAAAACHVLHSAFRARIFPRTCRSGIRPPAAPMQSFLPCRHICPCAWLIIRFAAGKIHLLTRARPLHAGVRAVESKTGDSTHGRVVAPQPISGFVVDNAVPDVL